jgi:hypothetical protein
MPDIHGVFAGRSRLRGLLPSPPQREDLLTIDGAPGQAVPPEPRSRIDGSVAPLASRAPRRRMPWAQLLRRVLHVEALSCPKCSTHLRAVSMVVLAFLTDPDGVERIGDCHPRNRGGRRCQPS